MEKFVHIHTKTDRIAATIHYKNEDDKHKHVILICHGFIGNKIGVDRLFVKAARFFESYHYTVVRFDYLGCGESEGSYVQNGLNDLLEQTIAVYRYIEQTLEPLSIHMIGHSLGGAVTSLLAPILKPDSITLWAPVAYPLLNIVSIVGDEKYKESLKKGTTDYLGFSLPRSFFRSLSEYHPLEKIKDYSHQCLLIHGSNDEDIPLTHGLEYGKQQVETIILEQANHTFSNGFHQQQLYTFTIDWLLSKRPSASFNK